MTSDGSDGSVQIEQEQPKKHLPLWQETILLLVVALGLAVLIKALLVQAFYIPSESMEPGLVRNDRILVQKVSYWFGGSPQRGDVVVFKDPGGWLSGSEAVGPPNTVTNLMAKIGLYPSGGHLVKRVIGVAGDVISCCDDQGRLEVNGVALNEKGYARKDGAECYGPMIGCNWHSTEVPDGTVFVMGDNRSHSADSTVHMCRASTDCVPGEEFVPVDLVVGRVFVLLWPRSHFQWLHRPADFAEIPDAPESPMSALPRGATVRSDAGLYGYERALRRTGLVHIAGADEAGRGACAGPLVAGAAILTDTKGGVIPGLNDSNLLTEKARERCYDQIVRRALSWSVVVIGHEECDRLGMHVANVEALRRAVALLDVAPDYVLTDGFPVDGLGVPGLAMWKGDRVAACIAAGSVLAKVTRDRIMCEMHEEWPAYDFRTHKGYITDAHAAALTEHGPSPVHRMRFVNVRRAAGLEPPLGAPLDPTRAELRRGH